MRNALVIVIVCLSVSLLYDVYKEPIDRLLHLDQTETNETTETGNRKQKTKKQAQKPDGQQEEGLPSAYDGRMTGKAPEVKNQAEAGTKETKEAIAALDERLKRVESGWGIDYKHDAVLGLCYMGAAYMSQHYERTVETAVLGATYVGNSYLANTF